MGSSGRYVDSVGPEILSNECTHAPDLIGGTSAVIFGQI